MYAAFSLGSLLIVTILFSTTRYGVAHLEQTKKCRAASLFLLPGSLLSKAGGRRDARCRSRRGPASAKCEGVLWTFFAETAAISDERRLFDSAQVATGQAVGEATPLTLLETVGFGVEG